MLRHMVMMKFADHVDATAIASIRDELESLQSLMGGISGFTWRENISPEDRVVHGLRHLFWFDFDTEADRDAYLVHPAHQATGARLVSLCDGGADGIVVCDFLR